MTWDACFGKRAAIYGFNDLVGFGLTYGESGRLDRTRKGRSLGGRDKIRSC